MLSTTALNIAYGLTWLVTLSVLLYPAFGGGVATALAVAFTALIMAFNYIVNRLREDTVA